MDEAYARSLLEKVRSGYDAIAADFSKTREYLWRPMIFLFDDYLESGDKVLDLGCGNGRFYEIFRRKEVDYTGADNSSKLVEIARRRNPGAKFLVADALDLPFKDGSFDKVYGIAVFHHIPSKAFRLRFLEEAKRVLRPEGIIVLTVWNLDPWRMIMAGKWKRLRAYLKYQLLKIFGLSRLDFGDFFVAWAKNCQRYVHAFSVKELEGLAAEAGFKIKKSGILKGERTKESNLYIVAQKPA